MMTPNTLPSPVAPTAPLCSVCGEPAIAAYVWDWGDSGFVCSVHQVGLHQQSRSLKRGVQITALTPGQPSEMTRKERIESYARVMAADDEVAEVKERNAKLFHANQALTKEVGRCTTQLAQAEQQIADLRAELEDGIGERQDLKRQLAEVTDEAVKLRGIVEAARTPG